tara:strand:- start:131 stop:445 length:315 start_codon:yes stop_codon:yes gene_type:complete
MDTQRYKELLKESKDYLIKDIIENDREFEAMKTDRYDFKARAYEAEKNLEVAQKERADLTTRINRVEDAILTIKAVHYSECYEETENPRKTSERLFLDHLLRIL